MEIIITAEPEDLKVTDEVTALIRKAVEKVGELYDVMDAEVSVTLTDNAHIQVINREYRGIDRPTDVISFALNESEEPELVGGPEVNVLGDVIISLERAAEQAEEYGHSYEREVAFLTVHSMLHLLGYDHMEADEAAVMEAKQKEYLDSIGISR